MSKSKLYDIKTAQRVIADYPIFREGEDPEVYRDILRTVYGKVFNGRHLDSWSTEVIFSAARNVHEKLRFTLTHPRPDLEERTEEIELTEIKPFKRQEPAQGTLFDNSPRPHQY